MPLAAILIEDSPTIREGLIPALAEVANVEVIAVAETAAEAIAAMRAHAETWQPAIVDLFLAEGNGLEVLRAGRERRPGQRMLVLTNYATSDTRRRALAGGADAVFDKATEIDLFFDRCRSYSAE